MYTLNVHRPFTPVWGLELTLLLYSQVWFQNARAKYRRHVLKQEQTKGDGQNGGDAEFRLSDDEKADDKTYVEMSNNSSSSLSDMSDIPPSVSDYDQHTPNGLSELFSSTISTMN